MPFWMEQVTLVERPEAAILPIIGRTGDLSALRAEIAHSGTGSRRLVVVEGVAGIGKSTLLDHCFDNYAGSAGTVLRARCHELAADGPFGVVRQLFVPLGLSAADVDGSPLLSGGARWAVPAFAPVVEPAAADPARTYSVVHGLYWLAANLMAEAPLVLVVDDVQWCDEPSLRWLGYLLRRTEGMPLCVVATTRPPARPELADSLAADWARLIRLEPLGRAEIREVIAATLHGEPTERFHAACVELSGGNPLRLSRLLGTVRRQGLGPDDGALAVLDEVGSDVVASSALSWVGTQPAHVGRVARAVGVLDDTRADLVAALSGVAVRTVRATLESLRDNDILAADRDGFAHELVRVALLGELPDDDLARLRATAARLLSDAGCPAEEIARQLLPLPRLAEPWMRAVLSDAAHDANGRGAPDAAARYLRALLPETPDDPALHARLAEQLAQTDPVQAMVHLRTALDGTADPRARAPLAVRFGMTALAVQRSPHAVTLLADTLDALAAEIGADPGPADRELRTLVESALVITGFDEKSTVPQVQERIRGMREPAGDTPAERQLLAMMAIGDVMRGEAPEVAVGRVNRALPVDEAAHGGWTILASAFVLDHAGAAPAALAALDRLLDHSRRRAAVWTNVLALSTRALILHGLGEFAEAAAESQLSLEIAGQEAWHPNAVQPTVALAAALARRGEAGRAEELLDGLVRPRMECFAVEYHHFLMARAATAQHLDRPDEALDHLYRCGRSLDEAGIANPVFTPWWLEAALILAATDRAAQAGELAERGEHLAGRWPVPRAGGLALIARSVVSADTKAVELLEEAVRVLRDSGARFDHQRAEHLLAGALLRKGDVRQAREHLRTAVDLANRCGARPAALAARDLLLAAGGRMRPITGARVDTLTGGERRVAAMAATGASNREIAKALFVTPRTVEVHLTNAYRKLGIADRGELAAVLREPPSRVADADVRPDI